MPADTGDRRGLALLLVAGLLAGCASDSGMLSPGVAVQSSDVGMGKALFLDVRDDRRRTSLPGAPLHGLKPVLRQELIAAYEAQDFRVLPRLVGDPCELTVELLALDQQDRTTDARLRALARKGRDSYGKDYAARVSRGVPTDESARIALLDEALGTAMADLARDPALLDFLVTNCNPPLETAAERAQREQAMQEQTIPEEPAGQAAEGWAGAGD